MDVILTDLSDTSLARAAKDNLYALFRSFQSSDQAKIAENAQTYRWVTPIAHPWFNGVLSLQVPDRGSPQEVRSHIEYFQSNFIQGATWWVAPQIDITAWGPVLANEGFIFDEDTPGMAVDLAGLAELSLPDQFELHPVTNAEELRAWTNIFIQGYGLPDSFTLPFYGLVASLGIELPFRYYLGFSGSKAVAASTLLLGAGAAGIYNVATLPGARCKGFGSAMTLAPLLEARRMGFRAGVLQSSEMGFPVYQRLGFRQVCRMEHFYKEIEYPE